MGRSGGGGNGLGERVSTDQPRITTDFNYGGKGRVYLHHATVAEIEAAGIAVTEGQMVTLSDHDEDQDGSPTWLVADGVLGSDRERGWYLDYDAVRWEPQESPR